MALPALCRSPVYQHQQDHEAYDTPYQPSKDPLCLAWHALLVSTHPAHRSSPTPLKLVNVHARYLLRHYLNSRCILSWTLGSGTGRRNTSTVLTTCPRSPVSVPLEIDASTSGEGEIDDVKYEEGREESEEQKQRAMARTQGERENSEESAEQYLLGVQGDAGERLSSPSTTASEGEEEKVFALGCEMCITNIEYNPSARMRVDTTQRKRRRRRMRELMGSCCSGRSRTCMQEGNVTHLRATRSKSGAVRTTATDRNAVQGFALRILMGMFAANDATVCAGIVDAVRTGHGFVFGRLRKSATDALAWATPKSTEPAITGASATTYVSSSSAPRSQREISGKTCGSAA
ncbi:hypothetical protein PENSPDRAFT_669266 [Peniophora sp. CONT]|nr:hypothetical protein PENSPDRAFT_669266 [Peniophora sp. CONT]